MHGLKENKNTGTKEEVKALTHEGEDAPMARISLQSKVVGEGP